MISLPVPLAPWISTGTSADAIMARSRWTFFIASDVPKITDWGGTSKLCSTVCFILAPSLPTSEFLLLSLTQYVHVQSQSCGKAMAEGTRVDGREDTATRLKTNGLEMN